MVIVCTEDTFATKGLMNDSEKECIFSLSNKLDTGTVVRVGYCIGIGHRSAVSIYLHITSTKTHVMTEEGREEQRKTE